MSRTASPSSAWRWLGTAALSAVLVGLGDVLLATAQAPSPVPAASLLGSLLAAIGLYSVPALGLGLCQVLLAASIGIDLPEALSFLRREVRDPDRDLRLFAAVLAACATLLLLAAAIYAFARFYAVEMANKRNTALSIALYSAAVLPLVSLGFFPCYRVLRFLGRALPPPRSAWALGLVLALGLLSVVLALGSIDWRVLNFGPWKALFCFVMIQVLLLSLSGRRAIGLRGEVLIAAGTGALLCLSIGYTFTRFGGDPRSRELLGEETAGAKWLLRVGRTLLDRDHDGYSALLGGGDCNDHDPQIHPGAPDPPGDGIDQDCDGADSLAPPVEPAAPPDPAAPPRPARAAAEAKKWAGNWLIITIDTLRADHVNAKHTPRIAALAEQGVRFSNVYAQAPNTPRSFPSFLTSRYPSQVHYLHPTFNFSPVTGQDPTLFTAFSDAGYRTIGIFSHFYLDERVGLAKGFDEWHNDGARTLHDSNSDISAPRITRRVIERLQALGAAGEAGATKPAPFVLWTHLFDPHSTYMDHPEFPVEGKGTRYLGARYDAEVAFTDLHVGKILDALKEAGLSETTAVVIFSDHGESFGEHKLGGEPLYFHGETLYDEVLRVPLVLQVPGMPPRVVPDRVMLIDLAPTLLGLSHIDPPEQFRGRSLVPALLGEALPPLPAYAEMLPCTGWQYNQRALISGDYKLYARFTENTNELYNIKDDPTEQKNLAHDLPDQVKALRRLLGPYLNAASGRP